MNLIRAFRYGTGSGSGSGSGVRVGGQESGSGLAEKREEEKTKHTTRLDKAWKLAGPVDRQADKDKDKEGLVFLTDEDVLLYSCMGLILRRAS
jgi:hypothetical protein